MLVEQHHIDNIREAFRKMRTKEDFLEVLNYTKPLVYGKNAIPFELKQLTYYSHPEFTSRKYISFQIKKRSGSNRTIHAPVRGLKALQKTMAFTLQCVFQPHKAAMGFVRNRSIIDNARIHAGSKYVYNIDLKDFFTSIDQARVWKCLQLMPFNLQNESTVAGNKDRISVIGKNSQEKIDLRTSSRLDLANMIACICCTGMEVERYENGVWKKQIRNVLPQGAPTSPVITNVVCQRLDHLLSGVAKRFGLKYTRYADDITFSSMHNVYQKNGEFIKELNRIIREQNFHIKESKTRLQKTGYRQQVTGLIVNEKVNIPNRYIQQLRMWLYYWERYGYEKANAFFQSHYQNEKKNIRKGLPALRDVIKGKLDYLKMIKGNKNEMYSKLRQRFEVLKDKLDSSNKLTEEFNVLKTSSFQVRPGLRTTSKTKKITRPIGILPRVHSPLQLVKILERFGSNNSRLKYTTHSWDFGRDLFKDYDDFIREIKSEFNELKDPLEELKPQTRQKIENFLVRDLSEGGKNFWGSNYIKFGWSNKELALALQTDPSLLPKNFILPDYAKKTVGGKLISLFGDVIDLFKKEIEIRGETDQLYNTLDWLTQPLTGDFKIILDESLKQQTFYTDVQWLEKGLEEIFDSIRNRPYHPVVEISARNSSGSATLILEILHRDSNCKYKSYNDPKFKLKSGGFGNIFFAFENLCDWSIETEFTEGPYRLNYLISETETPSIQPISTAEGFKHILTFYR